MAQDLADVLQRGPVAEHPGGEGMAQQVGPLEGRVQLGSCQRTVHEVPDGRGGRESPMRRIQADEDPPGRTAGGPTVAQVVRHGLSDLAGQRQGLASLSLAEHAHGSRMPVEIVERERCRFAAAQPQPGEQQEDGVVAPSGHSAAVTAAEDRLDCFWRE